LSIPQLISGGEPFFFPGGACGCLLIHGFTGAPNEMRGLGEYLHGQGHTVLGVRLSGHATQPEDMIRARWWDWLASVEDGWHLLHGCTERVVVIGLSLGGVLALTFASEYPVAGVAALATPHHLPKDPRLPFIKPLSLIQPFLPKGPPDWRDPSANMGQVCYPVDPTRAYAEVRDLLTVMRQGLAKISAPGLFVYSKDDKTIQVDEHHAELIYAGLGSQQKEIVWLETSGHVITRDINRGLVFQAVAEFVEQISRGGA